jgi:hypothetical protein
MLAGADATAPENDHERHDEGGPGDVECPAGHGGARDGSGVSRPQLSEILKIGQVWLMESQFADVFQGLTHLFHFTGRHEADGVPVPLIMEDAVVEPNRPVRGDQMIRENPLTSGWDVKLLGPLFEMHLRCHSISTFDVDRGVSGQVYDEVSFPELIHSGTTLKGHSFWASSNFCM